LFWQFVDHWQTLMAGGLALLAGVVTVWGTLSAANRQVKAANDAADREIRATPTRPTGRSPPREQTAAAEHQTAVTRELKRCRIAREGYAFHSREAYVIQQRVNRAGFAELRNSFLRFGGTRTEKFLQLDKEIEDLSAQFMMRVGPVTGAPCPPRASMPDFLNS
jgi:hypothetical protein